MRTIPHEAQDHPEIIVARERATEILDDWIERNRHYSPGLAEHLAGWPYVDLRDDLTGLLLDARGYDVDTLAEDLAMPPAGATVADILAAWTPGRGPDESPADEKGEGT